MVKAGEEVQIVDNRSGKDLTEVTLAQILFEEQKKQQAARKKQKQVQVKEIKVLSKTGDHDLQTKMGHMRKFIGNKDKVKVTIMFRMRELRRPENGYELLSRATEELAPVAAIESPPPERLQGRDLSMVLKPAS